MTSKQRIRFMQRAIAALEMTNSRFAQEIGVAQPRVPGWIHGRAPIRDTTLVATEGLLRRYRKWPLKGYDSRAVVTAVG